MIEKIKSQEELAIDACVSHHQVRVNFFKDVLSHIGKPKLIAAIREDGVDTGKGISLDADVTYVKLNSPKSKTRNWLIAQSLNIE